jgi:hypothetical protein
MLQGYTYNQALRLYRTHKVRVAVPLSPAALRKARVRGAALRAGLAEVAVAQLPYVRRGTFQSETDFQNELLAMRTEVHTAQVTLELHP